MFLEEICCRRSYVASRRRYVVGGDMLLKEICCWRRYVVAGDMLLKEISCWRRFVAGRDINGDIQPRGYPAKGAITECTRNPNPDEYIYIALVLYFLFCSSFNINVLLLVCNLMTTRILISAFGWFLSELVSTFHFYNKTSFGYLGTTLNDGRGAGVQLQ